MGAQPQLMITLVITLIQRFLLTVAVSIVVDVVDLEKSVNVLINSMGVIQPKFVKSSQIDLQVKTFLHQIQPFFQ